MGRKLKRQPRSPLRSLATPGADSTPLPAKPRALKAQVPLLPGVAAVWKNSTHGGWPAGGVCVLLALLVFTVFGQTIHHQFINCDDGKYVSQNSMVSQGLSADRVHWAFTHFHADNWHPLTTVSHMCDCQLYKLWAGGHHLSNILLHAAAAVLLFLMLREMTGRLWCSGFVAVVFAIHPLRAESVAWVAERKDVLSGIFFMLTLRAYIRFGRRSDSLRSYAWVVLWFALGLMSKPILVTVPFVLLLLDYWPLGRLQRGSQIPRLLKEKLPLFALSVILALATVVAQQRAIQPLRASPLSLRFENALIACVTYLWKLIFPIGLALPYPFPKNYYPVWEVTTATLLLVTLTAGAFLLRRKQPFLIVGWFWYLGMLLPVIGIVQAGGQAYADRFTYLPQIGVLIGGTWALAGWAGEHRQRRLLLGSLAAVILCILSAMAWRQTSFWKDSETLWTHTLRCDQNNCLAHNNLGEALREQGRTEEALSEYREALRIDLGFAKTRVNLGNILLERGRADEAAVQYREALRNDPACEEAHNNLGESLLRLGKRTEAMAEFHEALRIDPTACEAHYNLGNALLGQGYTDEATAEYREALRINPLYEEAHNNLAGALFRQGQTEQAVVEYREALRINPAAVDAHCNLAEALLQRGRTEEGLGEYRQALRINPACVNAHFNLGVRLGQQGSMEEAIAHLQTALDLQPANIAIENALALMLATAPRESLRNGMRAIQLAVQASQSAGDKNPELLRTLSIAYAETGDPSNALRAAHKALELAEAQSNTALADEMRREIKLYEAGRRYE